ncbi:TPA: hypothetical protein L3M65_003793 [Vibrio parahaemolyticus]|nr:hypothetical protein [Vibrio parahaemolyticus]
MLAEYIEELNLDPTHRYKLINSSWHRDNSHEADLHTYKEFSPSGELIGSFTVVDTITLKPPFDRKISIKNTSIISTNECEST